EMLAPEARLPDSDSDLRAPSLGVIVPIVREADRTSGVLDHPAGRIARPRHAFDPPARVVLLEPARLARPLVVTELGVAPPPRQQQHVVERHGPERQALAAQDRRTDRGAHASTESAPFETCGAKSAGKAFVSRSTLSRAMESSSSTPRSSSP